MHTVYSRSCLLALTISLLACGEAENTAASAAPGAASNTAPAAPSPAAPPAPAPPQALPTDVGGFGPFLLSANTVSADGECMNIGVSEDREAAERNIRQALVQAFHVPENGISSTAACPVAGVVGRCTIRQMNGVNYYYASGGPTPHTAQTAQADCERDRGVFAAN